MISSLCAKSKEVGHMAGGTEKCSTSDCRGIENFQKICSNCKGNGFYLFKIQGIYKVTCTKCKGKGIH